MTKGRIPANTTIGRVVLTVNDLKREIQFYESNLGLRLHASGAAHAELGAGGAPFLILEEDRNAKREERTSGLYHFAILVPNRLELAHALHRIVSTRSEIQGFADHHVSEAIYLFDAEGNEIEVYRDRPREGWLGADGQIRMGTDPLDTDALMRELEKNGSPHDRMHEDTRLGHIHLHVASIPQSDEFYAEVLGFDLIMHFGPAAGFVSAGGYHHHIGYNTWRGTNLKPAQTGSLGLKYFSIVVPSAEELERVIDRIEQKGIEHRREERRVFVRDPSGILIALETG